MVTTPGSGKSTTTVVGPATVLALLFIAGYTGCVASGPGEVVFETDEGSKCAPTEPYCVTVDNCPKAQRDIRRGQHPTICDWRGTVSLVCCTEPTSLPPVTPEPQPNPPTPLPGLSSVDGTGLPDTPPGGTSGGRDTSGGDDCDCEEEKRPLPVRSCGLRPEATESRVRPARLLFGEPVYSLDARRVRRPGLSKRRPLNALSLLPRQQLNRQPQHQQQQHQQQQALSSTPENIWPWMASVVDQVNPARRCAGVLLDQQHVLTAAQCFGPENGSNSAVMLNIPNAPITLRRVVSAEAHPHFRVPDGYHDLSVVRFEPALGPGQLVPICLPKVLNARRELNGSILDAVSWSNRQRDFHPGSMGEKRYQVISVSSCNNTYAGVDLSPYPAGISQEDFICTQLTTNVGDECVGIPGSPLMVQDGKHWTVIGMYSFGVSCSGTAQYPTVFTRVSPYVTWIYEKIGLR
ncbi:hypothetical protein HPB51_001433 [Rhipicephalus microplus]|uniref:Peptidase S1 domain-containing protein n=1 Tax=Rhipicephalus microplus TaxID=6941 RepID=A0A9J6EEK0_RHIMP|nr:hypothetical protein HPB51_001433 [Rhipicephalus microplus]